MEAADLAVVLLVIVATIAAIVWLIVSNESKRLRASSPPGALVAADDPIAVVRAKNDNYNQLLEAVRILNNIVQQDKVLPVLFEENRADVDRFLNDFYQRRVS